MYTSKAIAAEMRGLPLSTNTVVCSTFSPDDELVNGRKCRAARFDDYMAVRQLFAQQFLTLTLQDPFKCRNSCRRYPISQFARAREEINSTPWSRRDTLDPAPDGIAFLARACFADREDASPSYIFDMLDFALKQRGITDELTKCSSYVFTCLQQVPDYLWFGNPTVKHEFVT